MRRTAWMTAAAAIGALAGGAGAPPAAARQAQPAPAAPAATAPAAAPAATQSSAPAASAAPLAYPSALVLEEFAKACGDLSSIDVASAKMKVAGWEQFTADPASQMGELMSFGMGAAKKIEGDTPGYRVDGRTFRKAIGGRPFELALSLLETASYGSLGCRAFDFTSTQPIDPAVVAAFTHNEKPSLNVNQPGLIVTQVWEPGMFPGHEKFQVGFLPQTSEFKAMLHLSGVSLVTQTRYAREETGTQPDDPAPPVTSGPEAK